MGSIGVVLLQDEATGRVRVAEVPDGPSQAVLKSGDEIVMVDGERVSDMSPATLRASLRGNPGSEVRLTLMRNGEILRVVQKRTPMLAAGARAPK